MVRRWWHRNSAIRRIGTTIDEFCHVLSITLDMNSWLNVLPMSVLLGHFDDVRMLVLFLYDLTNVHLWTCTFSEFVTLYLDSWYNSCETSNIFSWYLWEKYEILIQRESPLEPCKFLSLRIPMPFTHLSNVPRGKDFVNKSAKLSHDLIYKILMSPPSCNSWV
jgi:hypothetical protein